LLKIVSEQALHN